MTRSPLRPLESKATFEQTLGALGDPALRTEADLAELALSAIFGATGAASAERPDTHGQPASDPDVPPDPETPAQPERPAPRPSFSFGAPANDDLATVRLLSPRAIARTARRLRLAVTLVPALLLGAALCIGLAQLQIGRYDLLPRLGIVLFTAGGALAIGAFLRDLVRMQAESLRAHTVELRRMAERLWEAESRLQADGEQAKTRAAALATDMGELAERLDYVIAVTESAHAAPPSRPDDTMQPLLAQVAALDARLSQGLDSLRADVATSHADLRQAIDEMARSDVAPEPVPQPPAAPDVLDFDLFCEGLLALAEGTAGTDRLRRARDLAGTTIEAIFDAAALLEVWDDYRRDGIAAFDDVYRGEGRPIMHRVRLQLQIDPLWRDAIETWLAGYEERIMAAAQEGRSYPLMSLLSSLHGRCYTLLAHASGRVESNDRH